MNLIKDYPPNIDQIAKVLPNARGKGVIFTYGDTIYAPHTENIPPELEAHEEVHCEQQGDDPDGWWERYLMDITFRFEQELEAHQEEYNVYSDMVRARNHRRVFLKAISKRLASPLYGSLITVEQAKRAIQGKSYKLRADI